MKNSLFRMVCMVVLLFVASLAFAQMLPRTILCGPFKEGHIQGFTVDTRRQYIYYSFTTMLVKTDMRGNVIGTVKGLLGHLGCLDFNDADGRVYGSLEYKNDEIGKGIMKMKRDSRQLPNAFYVAVFDVDKINRMNMDAEKDKVMTTVYLPTVLKDYLAEVHTNEGVKPHRLGCSGIDGLSIGPKFGKADGKRYLTVCYGIYGDGSRSDNDYQVLLQYDIRKWEQYETPLLQDNMHCNGPKNPEGQYFVYTGNTTYGIQNLEYDADRHSWFMAVYVGKKPQFPNYPMFEIDGMVRAKKQELKGVPYIRKGKVLTLKDAGSKDAVTGIYGWNFPHGSTGMHALGNGLFYFSENFNNADGQGSVLRLYQFTGNEDHPFEIVK